MLYENKLLGILEYRDKILWYQIIGIGYAKASPYIITKIVRQKLLK